MYSGAKLNSKQILSELNISDPNILQFIEGREKLIKKLKIRVKQLEKINDSLNSSNSSVSNSKNGQSLLQNCFQQKEQYREILIRSVTKINRILAQYVEESCEISSEPSIAFHDLIIGSELSSISQESLNGIQNSPDFTEILKKIDQVAAIVQLLKRRGNQSKPSIKQIKLDMNKKNNSDSQEIEFLRQSKNKENNTCSQDIQILKQEVKSLKKSQNQYQSLLKKAEITLNTFFEQLNLIHNEYKDKLKQKNKDELIAYCLKLLQRLKHIEEERDYANAKSQNDKQHICRKYQQMLHKMNTLKRRNRSKKRSVDK